MTKNRGIDVRKPKQECKDMKCPFHGALSMRGRTLTGRILSARMRNTAVFELQRKMLLKKYQRFEVRRTKISVHNPPCINAQANDLVRVMQCRPLSKTVNFVIIEKLAAGEE